MRILFVVGHPAHVHLFRNAIIELMERGHHVQIAAVDKESTLMLLAAYNLQYVVFGRNDPNMGLKILDTPRKDYRFLRLLRESATEIVVSTGSPYAAQASALRGIPHIAFSDTEIAVVVLRAMMPFTDAVCTPSVFSKDLGLKHVRYAGYKELAYLHPSRFTPQASVLDLIGASRDERLIVVRFASWDSSHDSRADGLAFRDPAEILSFIHHLGTYGRVLITSERKLPSELGRFVLEIPLERIHDLLFYSSLYIGEGATMASEAGVLGTPWIFISNASRGYLDDQEQKYGLGFWETLPEGAIDRVKEIFAFPDLKRSWAVKREALLRDKIDVTDFIVGFIEDWPGSFEGTKGRTPAIQEATE